MNNLHQQPVKITDVDIPFDRLVFIIKLAFATLAASVLFGIVGLIAMTVAGEVFGPFWK